MEETNQQKYDRLVTEHLNGEFKFFEFEGDSSCEDCDGWDGKSRRCECGNRRVSWVLADSGDYVYAEAW